ncbi:MAG TPA: MarP family serine protease [Candidatus Saccharimonadales bacterium]|nr:MarP family serine protease [Candidatus Saccharimonadales bacterium]
MNWVDAIIIVLAIAAIIRGLHAGLVLLVLSSGGFILGLLAGSEIAKAVAPHLGSPISKLVIVIIIEIGMAFLLAGLGEILALGVSLHTNLLRLQKANRMLGALLEMAFLLVVVWVVAFALQNVRSFHIGHQIRSSLLVRSLDSALGHPPRVFAELEKIVSPNGFPDVFLGLEPQHTTISPKNEVNNQAVVRDEDSVVKVEGTGCGGVVFGSGFVVARGYVITNAHVVAGIARPQVVDQSGTYRTSVVWFDPRADFAVLHIKNLPDPPLKLNYQILPDQDAAASLGFPGGGPMIIDRAVVIDHVSAEGQDIYNQGIVIRDIYEVQADIEPGDSGGPLVGPDGSVAGIVFAKSVSQTNVGYALVLKQLQPAINQAVHRTQAVSTGGCTPD